VRKYLLTVWLSRVHSRGLLPDLADDLLCLPEGVDPSTCRQVEGGTARSSPPPPATHTPFQQSETSAVDLCDGLYFGDNEYINWYWTVMVITFCFHQFLVGRLWAELLTSIVWGKSVKSWRTPIFCWCQYLWRFLHGGPVQ
jgi:hypothetical protein